MKWSSLYVDLVSALQSWPADRDRPEIFPGGMVPFSTWAEYLGLPSSPVGLAVFPLPEPPHVPAHESSYTSLLDHIFASRLDIVNSPHLVRSLGEDATRPEFALGRVRAQLEERAKLLDAVRNLLQHESISTDVHALLAKWLLNKDHAVKSHSLGDEITSVLEAIPQRTSEVQAVLKLKAHFNAPSKWIIGSDAWSYDLGASGFHHVVASGLNVNILLLDNQPYSMRTTADPRGRKKDAGLYAMNHGDVYVASVAIYSSYAQTLQALIEADEYPGPSVVLAHLPYISESDSALAILQETKLAVDSGYWPLYRWNPSLDKAGSEPFSLDSDAIKADLEEFLRRNNHLSQLTLSTPSLASDLVSSLGKTLEDARAVKAKATYDALLSAMQSTAPPVLVLYASDSGIAEKVAKRLGQRASARGLGVRIQTFDGLEGGIQGLVNEAKVGTTVLFITSTAGQGEPPQNGRELFKALNSAAASGSRPFAVTPEGAEEGAQEGLRYAVFGMGDSKYWPRPEDKGFYNKPGQDLDVRLEQLGGTRIVNLALGDDQDPDGPQTGYKLWEPKLWSALGVSGIQVHEAEPPTITNENIKIASNYLRGTIVQGLLDQSTGALAPSDGQLTKFHGIYEQDDRDIRDARKEAGLEPAYAFMIRVRMPGGVCKPAQWLAMDRIADERGNGTFKLTTRQTFQFHGVIKRHLKPSIQAINRALLDTIAACGDVNRWECHLQQ
jgi:sulfite reductase (NADPH) hemoprotein beta-component